MKCRRDVDKKCELTFLLAESGVPFLQEEEEGESWAGLQSINFTKPAFYATKQLPTYEDKHETNPPPQPSFMDP